MSREIKTSDLSPHIPAVDRPTIVAVDGPAASGKSTVGHAVADQLDYLFFDTGIMYRAVTLAALEQQVDLADEDALTALAQRIVIDLVPPAPDETDGRQCTVLVDGEDVTWQLRTPEVDQNVSSVWGVSGVRQALSAQQRRIGHRYGNGETDKRGIVMVGRDIGTVVLPDAGLKIYMDASAEERARRRFHEMQVRGKAVTYEETLHDIVRRDRLDSERVHSPLRPADDAVVIDTSDRHPEQVVAHIVALIAGPAATASPPRT